MSLGDEASKVDPNDVEEEIERSEWSRPIQFTLSLIGYTVGLNSICRFPYLALNYGGGTFLIAYSIFVLFCGIPLCYMEFTLGQFTGLSPVEAFEFAPLFKGIGWSMMLVSGKICTYYNIQMAWVLYYFFQSFQWNLPWRSCNNSWNTPNCFSYPAEEPFYYDSGWNKFNYGILAVSSILQYLFVRVGEVMYSYKYRVLELSENINELGGINWHICGCMFAAWTLTYLCLCKGIKSSGRAVYVTSLLPYLFFFLLVIRGVTLPGADIGLKYYLYPEWEILKSKEVWTQAAVQVFYTLGPAWGGLITLSSYNNYEYGYNRDALLLPLICGGTGIFGGLAVFSVVGHLAYKMGKLDISDFMNSGPGIAFIAYPEALAHIPGASVFAVCFFALLFSLGLDSQFATMETMISGFIDHFPHTLGRYKTLFTLCICIAQFLLGFVLVTRAGEYYFQVFDWYATPISIVVIATMEVISLSFVYGAKRLFSNAETMLGKRSKISQIFWITTWYLVTPSFVVYICVTVMMDDTPPVFTNGQPFPHWTTVFGWCISLISIIPIPLSASVEIWKHRKNLRNLFKPRNEWLKICANRRLKAELRKLPVEPVTLDFDDYDSD